MTASETPARPQRRVGTFTLGVVLVTAGCGMLVSLLWPAVEIEWLLKASPLILVALGVEVLLAARGGGRVKYDWLGMFLCFILVGAGLAMYSAAWFLSNGQELFSIYSSDRYDTHNCSRWVDETSYHMNCDYFNGMDCWGLYLEAGGALECQADIWGGWLEAEIVGQDGEALLERTLLNGSRRVEVTESGGYTITVYGDRARGGFDFQAVPAEEAEAPEEAPEEAEPPEELPEPAA